MYMYTVTSVLLILIHAVRRTLSKLFGVISMRQIDTKNTQVLHNF